MNGLVLEDLVAAYGSAPILNGISLSVRPGERVAIFGSNGAGKSTMLRAVVGTVQTVSGAVRYNGTSLSHMPVHARLALGIGYMPQRESLFPTLTVEENLLAAGCLRTEGRARQRERVAAAYGEFPTVQRNRSRPAGALSGGEQQLVALAKVWMQDPALILLDEPSAGLSRNWMDPVRETIGALCAGRRAMLMVEQNVAFALALCTRVCFLEFGRIVFDGPPARWKIDRRSKTLLWGDLHHAKTKRNQAAG